MGHEEGSMTPKTKLIIGLIVLWLSLWAFCLWLIWQQGLLVRRREMLGGGEGEGL